MRISKNVKNGLVNWMLGFIVLSPISSEITITYLHLPLSLPELLLFPFLPYLLNNYKFSNPLKTPLFQTLFFIWLFLVAIGIMHSNIFAVLSTSRTWLDIILTYSIFERYSSYRLKEFYVVSSGAIVGWLVASYKNFSIMMISDARNITYGPMLAVTIVIVYSLSKNKNLICLMFVLLCIIVGFLSGLRRELAVVVVSLMGGWFIQVSLKPKRLLKYVLLALFIIIATLFGYVYFADYIKDKSHFLYDRVVMKTESIFNGESNAGDEERLNKFNNYYDSFYEDIIPQGFLNKQYTNKEERGDGSYNDFPLLELSRTFSFPIAFALIIYFGICDIRLYYLLKKRKINSINGVFVIGGFVMLLLLFLEGSFITFPYVAPYTGFILGNIQRNSGVRLPILQRLKEW